MSNIAKAFAGGKAFIPFITCGDPDLATTAAAVRAMAANGADLIELGIPFSDPTAEGPVIQGANIRALKAGTTTDKVFDLVREVRRDVSIPMVFMTYANVVFSYGAEKFISTCAEIGIDGLILPDLPYEEKDEFLPICRKYGVDLISMIAPTSENRIAMIAKEAEGFLYIVSSLGVTGTRSEIKTDLASIVQVVRENTKTRHRFWHFHPGAGREDGRHRGRCHCGFGHHQAAGTVRHRRAGTHRGLRQEHEGRHPRINHRFESSNKQETEHLLCVPGREGVFCCVPGGQNLKTNWSRMDRSGLEKAEKARYNKSSRKTFFGPIKLVKTNLAERKAGRNVTHREGTS